MLIGCNSQELYSAPTLKELFLNQKELHRAAFNFYLTGSRAFLSATDLFQLHMLTEPDWDFFTEHTREVQVFLHGLGFRPDYEAVGLYTDRDTKGIWKKANIHVQFVTDVQRKVDIQQLIQSSYGRGEFYMLPKEVRAKIWGLAYDACYLGQREVKTALHDKFGW